MSARPRVEGDADDKPPERDGGSAKTHAARAKVAANKSASKDGHAAAGGGEAPPPVSTPRPHKPQRADESPIAGARLDGSERAPAAKPFLASEALIEDLAPLEPAGSTARLWCAALGVGFLLFGGMRLAGVGAGGLFGAAPELVLGGISLVAATVRLTYRQRAFTMVVLGLLSAMVGLRGFPGSQGWGPLRTLTAIALPAALLFRARYRAYAKARWILGAAVALSLPFAIVSVMRSLNLDLGLAQAGAVIAVLAVAASLLGFMGAETTGGGTATALGVVIALALDLALQGCGAAGARLNVRTVASVIAGSAVFAGTCAMASLGLFQILAWRFAADARRIDLHPTPKETPRRRMPSSDWSTKD